MPDRAEGVDLAVVDGRSGARAVVVAAQPAVFDVVLVRPEQIAVLQIEAEHALDAVGLVVLVACDRVFEVHREDAPVDRTDAAIPATDLFLPDLPQTGLGPFV